MWTVSKAILTASAARRGGNAGLFKKFVASVFVLAVILGDGVGAFDVELRAPSFVVRGGSALLKCDHGVDDKLLHKVEWLKDGEIKLFQFVRGRNPPFRNFSTPGATLDWNRSNEREIYLTGLDLEASGIYSCEVSMETPIYTKPSNDEVMTVIQRQSDDPELWGVRPSYIVGDKLEANCTSTPSHPAAHITWLVNGRQVSDQSLTWISGSPPPQFQRFRGGHSHRPFRVNPDASDEDDNDVLADEGIEEDGVGGRGTGGTGRDWGVEDEDVDEEEEEQEEEDNIDGGRGGGGGDSVERGGIKRAAGGGGGREIVAVSSDGIDADGESDDPDLESVQTTAPSSSTVKLAFKLSDKIVRILAEDSEIMKYPKRSEAKIRIILTCVATIPDFIGPDHEYADRRLASFAVDVISPLARDGSTLFGSASGLKPWNVILIPLLSLLVLLIPQPLPTFPVIPMSTARRRIVLPSLFHTLNPVRPRR